MGAALAPIVAGHLLKEMTFENRLYPRFKKKMKKRRGREEEEEEEESGGGNGVKELNREN